MYTARRRVLQMVYDHTLTVDQAVELLEAMELVPPGANASIARPEIVGASQLNQEFIKTLEKIAAMDAHVLIQGLGLIGENVLIQAAHLYHFGNLKKVRFTIVDHDVDKKINNLLLKYPLLEHVADITHVEQTDFYRYPFNTKVDDVAVTFLCTEDDGEAIYYSKKLRQVFFDQKKKFNDS